MKKLVFGIFAHPDDEAFLPSGSLIKWAENGAEIHLICATQGENGQNPDNVTGLGSIREQEWRVAGKLIGAHSQTQLNYPDGGLSNNLFHEIASSIMQVIIDTVGEHSSSISIDLVTYETCGITGHLDHIAMSYITTYIYCHLKPKYSHARLLYACACEAISPNTDTSFVFMPKGHSHTEIDITEDVHEVLERKKQVIRTHVSQRKDAEAIINRLGSNLAYEHFNLFKD